MADPRLLRPASPLSGSLLVASLLVLAGCASTPPQPQDPLALGSVPDERSGASQLSTTGIGAHHGGSRDFGGPDLGGNPASGSSGTATPGGGSLSLGSGGS